MTSIAAEDGRILGSLGSSMRTTPLPSARLAGLASHPRWLLRSTLRCKTFWAIMRCMASESRRSQMLRGVLDLCLLAVMDDGPAYGYEMTKRLRDRGLAIVGEGSIYPLLGRLERDGLVETYRAASNGGPPRKYYRPSSAGRLALALGVSEWRAARDAVDAVLAPVKVEVTS